jgi:hypothetical protein
MVRSSYHVMEERLEQNSTQDEGYAANDAQRLGTAAIRSLQHGK